MSVRGWRQCSEVQTLQFPSLVQPGPPRTERRRPWPIMLCLQEAAELAERERDPFFLHGFKLREWVDHLVAQADDEYGPANLRRFRVMQTGQAQRALLQSFGNTTAAEFADLLESLYRFTEYDCPAARLLFKALVPLAAEHQCYGDFVEPRAPDPSRRPREAVTLLRQSVERWWEWLDAVIHLRTHANYLTQAKGGWVFQELDEAIITLWPLLKRHHWTHGDLLNVLRDLLRRPEVQPCINDQALAHYCMHCLGLHRVGQGETAKGNRPAGYEVALRLCPPLRQANLPGEPPWSEAA